MSICKMPCYDLDSSIAIAYSQSSIAHLELHITCLEAAHYTFHATIQIVNRESDRSQAWVQGTPVVALPRRHRGRSEQGFRQSQSVPFGRKHQIVWRVCVRSEMIKPRFERSQEQGHCKQHTKSRGYHPPGKNYNIVSRIYCHTNNISFQETSASVSLSPHGYSTSTL
ncbi:hypothetical protein IQ07DRAFT_150116 [Pyrenochaeta sp. DS3sAY3a]|nr:hypothetical protein IQ07DRAFT_150116 [Pyrenochaeta sp. DS3sAY3a]